MTWGQAAPPIQLVTRLAGSTRVDRTMDRQGLARLRKDCGQADEAVSGRPPDTTDVAN